ncbi:MAG: hypothetical protein N2171_05985 [Clostridia bacterium]|nr:hypothetical protein [Clostridia bacterium]
MNSKKIKIMSTVVAILICTYGLAACKSSQGTNSGTTKEASQQTASSAAPVGDKGQRPDNGTPPSGAPADERGQRPDNGTPPSGAPAGDKGQRPDNGTPPSGVPAGSQTSSTGNSQ